MLPSNSTRIGQYSSQSAHKVSNICMLLIKWSYNYNCRLSSGLEQLLHSEELTSPCCKEDINVQIASAEQPKHIARVIKIWDLLLHSYLYDIMASDSVTYSNTKNFQKLSWSWHEYQKLLGIAIFLKLLLQKSVKDLILRKENKLSWASVIFSLFIRKILT